MLFIHNDVVQQVLTMQDSIDALEKAFRELVAGTATHRPRCDLYAPSARADGYYRWGTMEGANDGIFAIRMKSDIVFWPRDASGTWTEEKYCMQPGTWCGLVFLFSTETGEPLALINDGLIQHVRVGAGAGLGVKELSRKDASVVGMLGSGGMARTFLEAFCCVRDIKKVKIFSPTKANRETYAKEMSDKLRIEVEPVDSAREVHRGVDILSSCTDTMFPTIVAEWLEPGVHITIVNAFEISAESLAKCDVKIRQGIQGLKILEDVFEDEVGGDRLTVKAAIGHSPVAFVAGTPEQRKRLPPRNKSRDLVNVYPSYGDLISGQMSGRQNDRQITFYQNSGMQGLQFSAVGGVVYRKAKALGLGRQLPTEWFLQDIRD
jgi:ornithine cyclodeaminase/alanine dehydrogenase-like protein (mu-crystallin family)